MKEIATRKMAPGLGPKNSATGIEFRALYRKTMRVVYRKGHLNLLPDSLFDDSQWSVLPQLNIIGLIHPMSMPND